MSILDDVEQGMTAALKKIELDHLEALSDRYDAYLESWRDDVLTALKVVAKGSL
jgi:hypothetical protein